jgi:hypothetical protein
MRQRNRQCGNHTGENREPGIGSLFRALYFVASFRPVQTATYSNLSVTQDQGGAK